MTVWEYTTVTVAPGESRYDVLWKHGLEGWEAWHIEGPVGAGFRDIYFKRPKQSSEGSGLWKKVGETMD